MKTEPKILKQSPAVTSKPRKDIEVRKKVKGGKKPHSDHERSTKYDLLFFLVPLLFYKLTPVYPVYIIGFSRILATRIILTLHYCLFDKDNYDNKLTQKQLDRERDDYLVGTTLHMWVQVLLQVIFPGMFFSSDDHIKSCIISTALSHVLLVEPIYYFAHRWLHIPENMKTMHGFHHLSISTLPSTSLVQNFQEHFVYIATFGPAFFVPFFVGGQQHWKVIMAYLVWFDCVNAYGHTNIRVRHPIFTHPLSPFRYLFYTPEFHLGHHNLFRANYALFMPLWDLMLGTHREFTKDDSGALPAEQQDFVFIGHNGGFGHILTCPEFNVYNVYDKYKFMLPIQLDFLICDLFCSFVRILGVSTYSCSRYLIDGNKIGRIISIARSPLDYMLPKRYNAVNSDILGLIKKEYKIRGTRYFGLGNFNKMKQLNESGEKITKMVKEDDFLKDKNIRIWTGDSLTAASVYHQIAEIPGLTEFFFIGANGKIGDVVCEMFHKKRPDVKIRVFSRYHGMTYPNVSYTYDLSEMLKYKIVVTGKILPVHKYEQALKKAGRDNTAKKTELILDYTVPFIELKLPNIRHQQIGLLQVNSKKFLRGHFDICMSHDENHIYPCHAGCIINAAEGKEFDEVGDINIIEMDNIWKKALNYGLQNRIIDYD